jgi:hypothetical protein
MSSPATRTVRHKVQGGSSDAATAKMLEQIQKQLNVALKAVESKPAYSAVDGTDKQPYTVSMACPIGWGPASTKNVVDAIDAGRLHLPTQTPSLFKFHKSIDSKTGVEKNEVEFCLPRGAALDATNPRFHPKQAQDELEQLAKMLAEQQRAQGDDATLDLKFTCSGVTEESDCNDQCAWEFGKCIPKAYSIEALASGAPSAAPPATSSASAAGAGAGSGP